MCAIVDLTSLFQHMQRAWLTQLAVCDGKFWNHSLGRTHMSYNSLPIPLLHMSCGAGTMNVDDK